ncbi:hypothetical protein N7462_010260 [Penicillium macrosclerotiorum]|uniref:uncharacterized protein n=1 Tax=Penicillium macrosclerotiorum TaxID=303699 RepID=UPI0025488901|nr:uncharacterized protein N7462_010260 [Penicillium macrosclerotiorum]KAJ5669190.1 hypothetical protein N7462_010260 [Penicillium macrosclerotiorum]
MQSARRSLSSATTEHSPDRNDRESRSQVHCTAHSDVAERAASSLESGFDSVPTGSSRSDRERESGPYKILQYFCVELDARRAYVALVICGFVSGLVDGLSFNAWGSFSSMQTGNTVFIALGVSGQPEYPAYLWAKSLISLAVFLLSNVFFIHLCRTLNPLRRSTLILSFGLQTAALIVAASLVQVGIVSPRPEDPRAPIQWMQIIPITLLAFQAAGQICASRLLAFDEIPTLVVTTLLCDLLVDANLYTRPWSANPKRNRRIASFLALFLGAMTAGGLSRTTGMASSLWLAVALKSIITLSWFFWKGSSGGVRQKQDQSPV